MKTGRVLWWDDRHREGQLITTAGKKFYFNYSVIQNWPVHFIKRDATLEFKAVEILGCAIDVVFPSIKAEGGEE